MNETHISERTVLLGVMLAVFVVQFWINWSTADAPFWAVMMHEAGHTPEEFAIALTFRNVVFSVVGIVTSIGLLLLNYYLGKRYKLTRTSTIILILALVISILLGFLLGYGIRQLQLPQYSILNLGIVAMIPNRLVSPIVWCMLGMVAGNYKREIEQKRRLVDYPRSNISAN
ncbi:MAG: hypothetical protein ACE5L6_02900 [Candidatus Bathyarchaeia archaeon]